MILKVATLPFTLYKSYFGQKKSYNVNFSFFFPTSKQTQNSFLTKNIGLKLSILSNDWDMIYNLVNLWKNFWMNEAKTKIKMKNGFTYSL